MGFGCGNSGSSDDSGCGVCGADTDLKGSISSEQSGTAAMKGWVVVIVEKGSGISRISEVDNAGLFQFRKVKSSVPQTLVLLSPDYLVASVLSMAPATAGQQAIRQYFTLKSTVLPKLTHSGSIITFDDPSGVTPTNDLAADIDADGIPDGYDAAATAALWAAGREHFSLNDEEYEGFKLMTQVDRDLDGIDNSIDTDIDGDGIHNIFDSDDDGDTIRDVFDGDANDDLVNDAGTLKGDQYFEEGVEFIAVQYQKKPAATGTGSEITLTFNAKVRDDAAPTGVAIRGAPSLLNDAALQTTNADGEAAAVGWNRVLLDDGLSQDNQAGDRLVGAQVKLADGIAPRHNEVLFFELQFGSAGNPWFLEFPFTFPDITPGNVTASYANGTVTLLSFGATGPFGDIEDFKWSVNLYDEDGTRQWSSELTDGVTTTIAVPPAQLVAGKTYTYDVVAQVLAKVSGYPAYTIFSAAQTIP
jgi:hypothetical protein